MEKINLPTITPKRDTPKMQFTKLEAKRITLFVAAILMGRLIEFDFLGPFAIAYLAIFFNEELNFLFLSLFVLIGYFTQIAVVNIWAYVFTTLIVVAVHAFIKLKGIKLTTFKISLIFSTALLVVNLSAILVSDSNRFQLVTVLLEGALCFSLIHILSKAEPLLTRRIIKKKISNEMLIAVALIFAASIAGANKLNLGGLNVSNFLSYLCILVLGYSGDIAIGASAGVIIGLIKMIAGAQNIVFLAIFSIGGMVGGFLKSLGKVCTLAGFILVTISFGIYFNNEILNEQMYVDLGLAALCYLLLPQRFYKHLPTFNEKSDLTASEDEYLKRLKRFTSDRIHSVSTSYEKLSKTLNVLNEYEKPQKDISALIDEVSDKACGSCSMRSYCWENEFYDTYQTVFGILSARERRGKTTADDIPSAFYSKCRDVGRFVDTINQCYELYKNNLMWKSRISETKKLISQQLHGVATAMDNLSGEIELELRFKPDMEEKLLNMLNKMKVEVKSLVILENKQGKFEVTLTRKKCNHKDDCIPKILPLISKVTGRKMLVSNSDGCGIGIGIGIGSKAVCKMRFREDIVYKVTCGVARLTKTGMSISGDSYSFMELKDGKCMLALCDGMGSGQRAEEESAASVELLEQFMDSGFEQDLALKMINSILVLKSGDESFSTMDICVIDLYNGITQFAKTGASSTFLVRGSDVHVIKSKSLPAGILAELDVETSTKPLKENDIIVMMTDGVMDADSEYEDKERWICELLKSFKSNNPQDIAEYVLNEARKSYNGMIKDDMTLLAARLWKKN